MESLLLTSAESSPLIEPCLDKNTEQLRLSIIQKGLIKTNQRANIIIVGAGISGITAGYELLRAGHNVTILEATHRAGGRIYSLREPFAEGLYGEAGSMRYPPHHKLLLSYLEKFNLQTRRHLNYMPGGLFYLAGEKIRMSIGLSAAKYAPARALRLWGESIEPLEKLYFREKNLGNNPWPMLVEKFNEFSLRDFLVYNNWQETDIELFGIVGLGLGGYASIMNTSFLEIFRLFLVQNDKDQLGIVGGSDLLISRFLNDAPDPERPHLKLKDVIRFGAKVNHIEQNETEITLHYEKLGSSHSLQGDYSIMAIPFPMLRFISASPYLSRGKQRVINELHHFSSTKIFLQCRSRFWEREHNRVRGMVLTDLPIRSLYFPEKENDDQRNVMIASYTWEAEARMWDAIPPEEKIKMAVRFVAKIFPEVIDEFEVGASVSWNDPKLHTGGAFAIFAPGQLSSFYKDIIKAEGLLHFAGDHTSFEHGWVEGAIESGLREASLITQRLQLKVNQRGRYQDERNGLR